MQSPIAARASSEISPLIQKANTTNVRIDARRIPSIKLRIWLIMVLISIGEELMESPQTRILESIVCYLHFEKFDPQLINIGRKSIGPGAISGIRERFCKVDPVQSKLSAIRGVQQLLDGVPALLLAIPLGRATDTYGRKPILFFGLLSLILRALWTQGVTWWWQTFDVRMTWLSTLHMLLGGGSLAITGPLYAMVSDMSSLGELDLGKEFLRLNTASLLATLLTQPISAGLMNIDPWIPNLLGTGIMSLGLLLIISIPETLVFRTNNGVSQEHGFTAKLPASQDCGIISLLRRDWRILALISPLIGHMLLNKVTPILLQYCSSRYRLTMSEATYLLALFSGGKTLLLCFFLPLASEFVKRRWALSDQEKNLYFTQLSQSVMVVGWAFVGMAPHVIIVAFALVTSSLGFGVFALSRSLLTSLVPSDQVGRIYGVIAVVDTVGAMLGGISLAKLYEQGLKAGPGWEGLSFFALSLLCLISLGLLLLVRIQGSKT